MLSYFVLLLFILRSSPTLPGTMGVLVPLILFFYESAIIRTMLLGLQTCHL
jgi:hypothetical protein